MNQITTVPCDRDVTVTTTAPLIHLCPHRDEEDRGTITITWACDGQTFELHSLTEYLGTWANARVSHEDITDRIRHDLSTYDGIVIESVLTTWRTAGMEVRCSTPPTRADQTP